MSKAIDKAGEALDQIKRDLDTYRLIKEHGLMIRQIPEAVYSTVEMRHFVEGDEVLKSPPGFGGRDMCRKRRVPANPGYWMCRPCGHTRSTVRWNIKTDHLAPTLEESVALYVAAEDRQS